MAQFFILLALVSILICVGVVVNLYFYSKGAVGRRRFRRPRRLQPATVNPLSQEAIMEQQYYMHLGRADDDAARYNRLGILFMIGIVAMVAVVLISIINAIPH